MMDKFRTRGGDAAGKAVNFAEYAKTYGWSGKWDTSDGMLRLAAHRGDNEFIDIEWDSETGKFIGASYTLAGETIDCHNVSAAAAIAAKAPDADRLRTAARKHRKQLGTPDTVQDVADLIASISGTLPFDHESTDEEIKAKLNGKRVAWVNRMSGMMYSAVVGGKMFKVVGNNEHRYIDFADSFGYHAVYLNSIVSVEVTHHDY